MGTKTQIDYTHVGDYQILIHRKPWDPYYDFLIRGRTIGPSNQRQIVIVKNIVYETLQDGDRLDIIEPTFRLDRANLQALMDELWNAGIRPSDHESKGELDATKKHLKDMRTIALKSLDIEA